MKTTMYKERTNHEVLVSPVYYLSINTENAWNPTLQTTTLIHYNSVMNRLLSQTLYRQLKVTPNLGWEVYTCFPGMFLAIVHLSLALCSSIADTSQLLTVLTNGLDTTLLRITNYFLMYLVTHHNKTIQINKQEVLGRTNRLFPLIPHGPPPTILHCRGNVFTKLLPSNEKGIYRQTHRHTYSVILLLLRVFLAAETCLSSRCLAVNGERHFTESWRSNDRSDTRTDTLADENDL
jgi:hypothetical protein